MSEAGGVDFLRDKSLGFGAIDARAESFHGPLSEARHSLCETWWFTAHAPDRNVSSYFYISTRPNLGMCSAGVWIWKDFISHPLMAIHQNYQNWLPLPDFERDRISVPHVGLVFHVERPLERIRIDYRSSDGSVRADLVCSAAAPPVMRANEKHFEQACTVEGVLEIRGEKLQLSSMAFRDRSWGEARSEDSLIHPPITWLAGMSEDGRVAFNLSGTDETRGAEWEGVYEPPARTLFDGWIVKDGVMRKIVAMSKRSERDPSKRMRPGLIHANFSDDRGEQHELVVRPVNGIPAAIWSNIYALFSLTRWELDGVSGFGELNDFMWADYANRYWRE